MHWTYACEKVSEKEIMSCMEYAISKDIERNSLSSELIGALIRKASIDAIEKLIKSGADVNAEDNLGKTVLEYAIDGCTPAKGIKMLINAGAKATKKLRGYRTLLMYAVQNKAPLSVIKLLLNVGLDVNTRDVNGNTALIYAIKCRGNYYVIEELLIRGALVDIANNFGITPLALSKVCQRHRLANELVQFKSSTRNESKRKRKSDIPKEEYSSKKSRAI